MEVGLPPEAVLRRVETHTHTQSDGCATLRWWQVLISFQNSIFILCKHLRLALTFATAAAVSLLRVSLKMSVSPAIRKKKDQLFSVSREAGLKAFSFSRSTLPESPLTFLTETQKSFQAESTSCKPLPSECIDYKRKKKKNPMESASGIVSQWFLRFCRRTEHR